MAQRSQLVVGQEWAYQRGRNHEHTAWGGHEKAVIVAVEPYEQSKYRGEIFQRATGNGVKVEIQTYWAGNPQKITKVVQLSQLWKPWAEYEVGQVEYKAQYEIAQKKAAIAKAEREKFQREVYQPAYREFKKVLEAVTGKYVSDYTRVEELPIEVIQAITEAIKEKAVA